MRKVKKRVCFVVARCERYEAPSVFAICTTRKKAEKFQATVRCGSEIYETEMNADLCGMFLE